MNNPSQKADYFILEFTKLNRLHENLLMEQIAIIEADLGNDSHANAVLHILNSYANDPMGMGAPLSAEVKNNLIRELIAFQGALCLLAFEGEKPAGLANCFFGFSTFNAKKVLNIHDLAVEPGFRSRGIGYKLLKAVEKKARESGCCKVTLEVREDNRARKLYERSGFNYGNPATYYMTKVLK